MATDKTPTHKRISSAENSSMQWKMKAIERREAAERLKEQLETEAKNVQSKNAELDAANKRCADLEKQLIKLAEQLKFAGQAISKQQVELNTFKKKQFR